MKFLIFRGIMCLSRKWCNGYFCVVERDFKLDCEEERKRGGYKSNYLRFRLSERIGFF